MCLPKHDVCIYPFVYNDTQGNTCCRWLEPSEVWCVTGGHCFLPKNLVVASFAQTSIEIILLTHRLHKLLPQPYCTVLLQVYESNIASLVYSVHLKRFLSDVCSRVYMYGFS